MINQLAKHYGVEPGAIVGYAEVDGGAVIRVLVNYGIGGIKVLYVPVDDLAEDDDSTIATFDLDYRELQALAKEQDIPANQSKDALIAALWPSYEEEE